MYLHLGQSTLVPYKDIIGIFDLDTSTVQKATRDYLREAEKNKQVVNVSYDLPKSFIVCKGEKNDEGKADIPFIVYISPIAPSTLLKRIEYNFDKEL